MTDLLEFSPKAIIAMGVKRIQPLVEKHGITSPEVLAACERWGGMLDEVNYPDSSCRWCGLAVAHTWEHELDGGPAWIHTETKRYQCWEGAPAVAAPFKLDGTKTGRMSSTTPDLKAIPGKHPLTKKPMNPRSNNPQMYMGPDEHQQMLANQRERAYEQSFKPLGKVARYNDQGQRMIGDNPQA